MDSLHQEFNLEVHDLKGVENQVATHLSRLKSHAHVINDTISICEEFLDEQLMALEVVEIRWYADIVN